MTVEIDPIERIVCPPNENLRKILKRQKTPVILQGCVHNWPAVGKWQPAFFQKHHGACEVVVERSREAVVPTRPERYIHARYYETAQLGATLQAMREHGSAHGGYITYAKIFEALPALLADITALPETAGFPGWVPRWLRKKWMLNPGFWLGPKGAISPLHFDRHDNLNVQIYGKKRWIVFAPKQSRAVYYKTDRHLPVIFSPVDVSAPDLQRFPHFAGARRYDFVLEAGETLYLPPGWWHYVESLDEAINVNFWWWSPRALYTVLRVEIASLSQFLLRKAARGKKPPSTPTSMPL